MSAHENIADVNLPASSASTESTDYSYPLVPLPVGKYTRILDVLPGRFNDELHLDLRSCEITTTSNYEALSYTWGARTEGHSVVVNKTYRLPVTDNLFRALRRLRRRFKKRTIWIDAVCINQTDLRERSSQVQMMRDIYRCATCVNIWIGEPASRTPFCRGIKDTLILFDSIRRDKFWARLFMVHRILRGEPRQLDNAVQNTIPCWHKRAWVLQEFLVAREARILFGPRNWKINLLGLFRWGFSIGRNDIPRVRLLHRHLFGASGFQKRSITLQGLDLLQMTCVLRDVEATDPRDMVYSVLGLIDEAEAHLIGVDYKLTLSDVYATATYASMRCRNDLAILRGVRSFEGPGRLGLPSWVVNYSSNEDLRRLDGVAMPDVPTEQRPAVSYMPELDSVFKVLSLSGINCGSVMKIFPLWEETVTGDIAQAIRQTIERYSASHSSPMPISMLCRAADFPWDAEPFHQDKSFDIMSAMCLSIGMLLLGVGRTKTLYDIICSWDACARAPSNDTPQKAKACESDGVERQFKQSRSRIDFDSSLDSPYLFILDTGLIGLAGGGLGYGDEIVACHIACDNFKTQRELARDPSPKPSPILILRSNGESHKFRGLAWVHRCMHKEIWEGWNVIEEYREAFRIT